MNKEDIKELQEYNLKYLEAINSEEIFGGDYTSEVELEYVKKENNRLQQELERYKNIIDELEIYLQRKYGEYIDMESDDAFVISLVLDTLRELKGE